MSVFGFSILMTTHNLEYSLLLDSDVWIMDAASNIRVGTTSDIIDEDILTSLYETEICIMESNLVGRKACLIKSL